MKEDYFLYNYEIDIDKDGNYTIAYTYITPTYHYNYQTDNYHESNTYHTYIENYDNRHSLVESACELNVYNLNEYDKNGNEKTTFYKKEDLEEVVNLDKSSIINKLRSNLYKKTVSSEDEYKIEYFCGLILYYGNNNELHGVEYSNDTIKISKLSYFENNKQIRIDFKDAFNPFKIETDNIIIIYKDNYIEVRKDNKIKRFPNRCPEKYNIEFLDNGYYIQPKNGGKELYNYSGMRIDKYPLIEKDTPDNSFGSQITIQNEKFGSFVCKNILGLPIGGQLDSGVTYLYLYHDDGSYVKTYSDGDNRYFDSENNWDRSAKATVEPNGTHKLTFRNGQVKAYNINGKEV